jgi:hypothetical protein
LPDYSHALTTLQCDSFELAGGGYSIHCPDISKDVGMDDLLFFVPMSNAARQWLTPAFGDRAWNRAV